MIRLATCFSGIGAIEHALNRMGIDNEIVFACDNGDVDILSKEIPLDIEIMSKEFKELEDLIKDIGIDEYKIELENDLIRDDNLFLKQIEELRVVDSSVTETVISVLLAVISMEGIKKSRAKEYRGFLEKIKSIVESIEVNDTNRSLYSLSYAVEITNDFHKDNSWNSLDIDTEYKSTDNIDWNAIKDDVKKLRDFIDAINGRRVLKNNRDICERLGMLHEKIHTLEINDKLSKLNGYDEKKHI